jgi:hypothetical protein
MAVLVTAIHVFRSANKTWMAGMKPAMTMGESARFGGALTSASGT